MAGVTGLSAEWALNMLFGVSINYTTAFSCYIGLATADPGFTPTLSGVAEVSATGYARVAATFSAATDASPPTATLLCGDDTNYGPFTASTGSGTDPITHAFLTTAASGTSGDINWVWQLASPISCGQNGALLIPANSLIANLANVS